MPTYKNVAASCLGITKGSGAQAGRTIVPPGEVFECDAALLEHHLKRGRVQPMSEADLAEHRRKGGTIAQLNDWYH